MLSRPTNVTRAAIAGAIAICAILAALPAQAGTETKTFKPVMVRDGYAADWCLKAGLDCGKAAADQFCETKGFQQSRSFDAPAPRGLTPPKSIFQGNGNICEKDCRPLVAVTCTRNTGGGLNVTATSTTDIGEVGN